jgi:hypothetical protein
METVSTGHGVGQIIGEYLKPTFRFTTSTVTERTVIKCVKCHHEWHNASGGQYHYRKKDNGWWDCKETRTEKLSETGLFTALALEIYGVNSILTTYCDWRRPILGFCKGNGVYSGHLTDRNTLLYQETSSGCRVRISADLYTHTVDTFNMEFPENLYPRTQVLADLLACSWSY